MGQKVGQRCQKRVDEIMKLLLLVPLLIFCWASCASAGVTQREEESPKERGAELASGRSTPTAADEGRSEDKAGPLLQDKVEPYSDREAKVSTDGYHASDRRRRSRRSRRSRRRIYRRVIRSRRQRG